MTPTQNCELQQQRRYGSTIVYHGATGTQTIYFGGKAYTEDQFNKLFPVPEVVKVETFNKGENKDGTKVGKG